LQNQRLERDFVDQPKAWACLAIDKLLPRSEIHAASKMIPKKLPDFLQAISVKFGTIETCFVKLLEPTDG